MPWFYWDSSKKEKKKKEKVIKTFMSEVFTL